MYVMYVCFCIYVCVCVCVCVYSHTIHMYRYSIFLLLPSFLVMENIGVHAFFPLCLFTKSMITLCFSYFFNMEILLKHQNVSY